MTDAPTRREPPLASSASREGEPAPVAQAEAGRRRRWWARGFAGFAALVAVLGGLTALFDWFEERVAPAPPPPPAAIDARLTGVQLVNATEPLESYLRAINEPLDGMSKREREEPGLRFRVRVRFVGNIGRSFPLRWSLYDLDRKRTVPGDIYAQEAVVFTPESADHARTWPIWVPYPPNPGRYRLDVVLTDAKAQPVAERSSKPVAIERVPDVI